MTFNIQNATIHQTTTSTTDNTSKLDLETKINELEARLSKLESFITSSTIPTPANDTKIEEPTSDIELKTNVDVSNTINTKIEEPTTPIIPSNNIDIKIEDDKVIETTPTILPEDDKIFNNDILEEDEYIIPSTVLPLSDSYNAYVEQFKLESNKKATKKAVSIYILNALKEKYYDSNPDIFDNINYNKFNSMSGSVLYNLAEDIHNQIMLIVNNSSSDTNDTQLQKLINKYSEMEELINELWYDEKRWIKSYIDEMGNKITQWDSDVIITPSFKYTAIEMMLESHLDDIRKNEIANRQKYKLSSGFPNNRGFDIPNKDTKNGVEQLYLWINDKRVFISIDMEINPDNINNAIVEVVDNNIYVNKQLVSNTFDLETKIEDIKSTDTNIDVTLEELEDFDSYDLDDDIKSTDDVDSILEELEDFDSYDLEPEELEDTTTISNDDIDYNAKFEEFKSSLNTDGKCDLSDIKWSDIDTYDKLEANFINNKNYFRFGTKWKLDFILSELGISLNNLKKLDDNEAYYKIICTYFAKVQDTNIQGV